MLNPASSVLLGRT